MLSQMVDPLGVKASCILHEHATKTRNIHACLPYVAVAAPPKTLALCEDSFAMSCAATIRLDRSLPCRHAARFESGHTSGGTSTCEHSGVICSAEGATLLPYSKGCTGDTIEQRCLSAVAVDSRYSRRDVCLECLCITVKSDMCRHPVYLQTRNACLGFCIRAKTLLTRI